MLGNQYFMGRHYYEAKNEFEVELLKQPSNINIKKKLIICYTQTNLVDRALDLFHQVIIDDIDFIVSTDPVRDDCPCPELVNKVKTPNKVFKDELEENIVNGIIWLYCDTEESLKHFKLAFSLNPADRKIETIIDEIEKFTENRNQLNHTNQNGSVI